MSCFGFEDDLHNLRKRYSILFRLYAENIHGSCIEGGEPCEKCKEYVRQKVEKELEKESKDDRDKER